MSRKPSPTDFFLDIPGVGNFSFAKRTLRDEMAIAAEYSRLTEGIDTPTTWLGYVATWIAALKVLVVTAPESWDIDAMDPLDQSTYDTLRDVHAALREKEDSFRKGPAKVGEAARTGDVGEPGVLVPAQVQPGAD